MTVNQKPARSGGGPRLEAHWRLVSWAMLDKSLQLVFGLAFLLLVVRSLPREEFGLQGVASTVVLTTSQLLRSLVLVPLIKYVAEARGPARIAATGTWLYVAASAVFAIALWGGRAVWAGLFHKPELALVLVPSAWLLAVGSPRDAAISSLEGQRRLRAVFFLDLVYYALAIGSLAVWWRGGWPRAAATVQWFQVLAAAGGALLALATTRAYIFRAPSRFEAGRLLRFGASVFGSGFGATLSQQADMFLAGRMMDARGVGTYTAARQIFRVFNILAQAINQFMMPTVSRLHGEGRRDDLRILFEKSVCFLGLVLVPVCLGLVLFAGPLLDLLFQGRYADSIPAFQILVLGALTLPLASVGSPFLTGLGDLRSLLWMTWGSILLSLGLAVLWIPHYGPAGAAAASVAGAVFGMITRAVVLRRRLGFHYWGIVARVLDAIAFARRRWQAWRHPAPVD